MHKLEERKQQLISSLLNDIGSTTSLFKALVVGDSDISNELILIEARLISADKKRLQGTIKDEDLQIEYNKIRASLLELINTLEGEYLNPNFEEEQFNKQNQPSKSTKNQGSILYHIPDVMAVEQEAKCVIRIAFDEEILVENFEVTVETEIENIRVSEVMQVDMIDPSDNTHFKIRTYSSKEQIVDVDAYTEWVYYVKPLKAGTYPLILKVAVIELVREKERKREIVLEEQIQIVAETEKSVDTPILFKTSDESIQVGSSEQPLVSVPPLPDESVNVNESLPSSGIEMPAEPPKSIPFNKIEKRSPSIPDSQAKAPSEDFSFSSGRKRPPIGAILTVVTILIASSWLLFSPVGVNKSGEEAGFNAGDEEKHATVSSSFDVDLYPQLDTVFCGMDTLNLKSRLIVLNDEVINSSESRSPDGVKEFYKLLTFVQMQCPSLQFPNFTTYRTPTDIALWYYENGLLQLVDLSKQSVNDLPNGVVLFQLKEDISLNEYSTDFLWEEGPIERLDVFMKGDTIPEIGEQAYFISSIVVTE